MNTKSRAEPESVLLFLQGSSPADHPGILDGYERLKARGEIRHLDVMPVFGAAGTVRGGDFWKEALDRALGNSATIVVFQYYHSARLPNPREAIDSLKRLPSAPLVVSTLGDAFMNGYCGRPSVPASFLQAAEASDLVTLTSMGEMADHIARHTRAPIILSPNGACQVRFGTPASLSSRSEPEFDVVFIGSRNSSRNPLRPYYRFGRQREQLVRKLERRFGNRFGLFGSGWEGRPSSHGPVPFSEQVNTARRGRIVLGGVPFSTARYYTSNRPFIQATSSVPLVDTGVPGVELLLRPGEHWVLSDLEGLVGAAERTLQLSDQQRMQMGQSSAEHVLAHHTQAHRVAALLENVRRVRASKHGEPTPPPHLPFFLAGTDLAREQPLATRNWPRPETKVVA